MTISKSFSQSHLYIGFSWYGTTNNEAHTVVQSIQLFDIENQYQSTDHKLRKINEYHKQQMKYHLV